VPGSASFALICSPMNPKMWILARAAPFPELTGLYWNKDEFLGGQYGTGAYRVMRWQLSPDGRKVTASEIPEHRTDLVSNPTTDALLGDDFYFIAYMLATRSMSLTAIYVNRPLSLYESAPLE
jgi:hypothetical protein